MEDYTHFKIIVLGSQGVGKSSLINRYIKGEFNEQYHVTVGVEYASKIIHLDERNKVRLQIWDTAGQELFRSVVRSFYKGISAVFLLYAIDRAESLKELEEWVREVRENAHEDVVLFLIGARADVDDKKVTSQEAEAFLKEIGGVFHIETSAKTGQNIEQLFRRASETLHKKFVGKETFQTLVKPTVAQTSTIRSDSVYLRARTSTTRKKKRCC